MTITILYSDDNPADYHRLLLPAKFIEGHTIRLIKHTECAAKESSFHCDIVFLSRLFIYDWSTMDQLRKKYGFKIVLDFDDYHTLQPHQLRYKLWQDHNVASRMIEAAANADLIFVTTEQLCNVYKEFNKNVLIIPNAVPFNEQNVSENYTTVPKKELSDKIRFIYAAGASHYSDLKLLKGLFDRLRSDGQFKNKANFTFCGYDQRIIECHKMESICKINGSYIRRDILPLKTYMDHYNFGDVSIAPLINNFYNNCKSNLKFIEAASMKLGFICSEILPYTKDLELKNKGILFCNNTNDWYKAFNYFVHNPNAIKDFGEVNYEYAKARYNIKEANKLRLHGFESIL